MIDVLDAQIRLHWTGTGKEEREEPKITKVFGAVTVVLSIF